MNKPDTRTANLLGALSLMLSDAMTDELGGLTDICDSDCAALIVIEQNPGITVDRLAKIVRLSQPGAVRMINRLVEEGRVERQTGIDRRARPLGLTAEGQRMVRAMLLGREKVLRAPLDALTDDERRSLEHLIEKMLQSMVTDEVASDTACRLCDDNACPQDRCPLAPNCSRAA
ncbi:MarR family winged helix-turn-helix transcriptional regulator [Dongia rigui]|uniref:MarR family winged helix-turn-helix transcriptional regulator n=1 Tax=Dongia rigui TaxID=940149 RepID=A0ABU5E4E8_9PROT|nr:MarR family winged helix-turn-helix transcriptional regulator [Dongia rigui]MDY0874232.1 MarR family winged helix-turn-helix transcriptional regulator [Dongia rigui]